VTTGRLVALFLVLVFGVTVVARSFDPHAFNHDVAFILYASEQMLDGQTLYRDIIDENPPLIFWLSVIPVAIARSLGATAILVFNLMTLVLVGGVCLLVHRVLRIGWRDSSPTYRLAIVLCLAALVICFPGYDYGQRTVLYFVLVSPYLFAAAARARGKPISAGTAYCAGVLAGLGFAFKPHYAVLFVVVEFWLLRQRIASRSWLRPEVQAVIAVQLLVAGATLGFAGGYLDVLRIAVAGYPAYGALGSPLLLVSPATAEVALAAGLYWLIRDTPADRELRAVWLVAAVALLGVGFVQGTGWGYHYYPASAAALLLMAIVTLGLTNREESLADVLRLRASRLPGLAMLLVAVYGAGSVATASLAAWGPGAPQRSVLTDLVRVVETNAWRQPLYVMSTSVAPAFPLVNLSEARWASRFCCIWLLPGLYSKEERETSPFPYHEREDMSELELKLIDAVVEDLRAAPPALLIVDQSPTKQGFGVSAFDFLGYFRRDPRFVAIFREYSELGRVGYYRVFRRKGSTG
jgi:hypothetical protein